MPGVLSGMVGNVSHDFIHPELVLAAMVYALTDSMLLVALITVVSKAAILAPQLLVGSQLEHLPRKRPYFVLMAGLRRAGVAGMVGALAMLTRGVDGVSLTVPYLSYGPVSVICASRLTEQPPSAADLPAGRADEPA